MNLTIAVRFEDNNLLTFPAFAAFMLVYWHRSCRWTSQSQFNSRTTTYSRFQPLLHLCWAFAWGLRLAEWPDGLSIITIIGQSHLNMPKWAENLPNTTWTSKLAKSFNNFARLEEFCQIWSHGWSVRNEIGLRYNCASSKNECTIETKSWMEAREREIKMMNWWSFLSINVHLFASK